MILAKVKGVDRLKAKMKTKEESLGRAYERGMKKFAALIMRASQKVVPVLTGNLKNSKFIESKGSGFSFVIWLGYAASYAIYVHENLEARHKSGKQAKFLTGPARELAPEGEKIVREEMRRAK